MLGNQGEPEREELPFPLFREAFSLSEQACIVDRLLKNGHSVGGLPYCTEAMETVTDSVFNPFSEWGRRLGGRVGAVSLYTGAQCNLIFFST